MRQICQWFPRERITRKRNLVLMVVGLYLGASVHLSHIARELPIPGKDPSLANRLRRFPEPQLLMLQLCLDRSTELMSQSNDPGHAG